MNQSFPKDGLELFFETLRENISYGERTKYIRILSALENLNLYRKLDELLKCKENWKESSKALADVCKEIGVQIVHMHADDLVDDQISGYKLGEISEFSAVPCSFLVLELVKEFTRPFTFAPAAAWLGFCCFICEEVGESEGRAAISRLLNSEAAKKLSSRTLDGEWRDGFYPKDKNDIFSGLVWRMLGSPDAGDRWRAAHSVRCFARFKRWSVLDSLVAGMDQKEAHPFQAPDIPFYFMHAKLWFLIALARIALDNPEAVARYKEALLKVAFEKKNPHILMMHFAGKAILTCADAGALDLPDDIEESLRLVDQSPFPRLRKKLKKRQDYASRPSGAPGIKPKFYFNYEFEKDIERLSDVFGKASWKVKDMIAQTTRCIDPEVTGMYDAGNRRTYNHHINEMDSGFDIHGQQVGWHALFLTAAKLIKDNPVTNDSLYPDDPWNKWLREYTLNPKGWIMACRRHGQGSSEFSCNSA